MVQFIFMICITIVLYTGPTKADEIVVNAFMTAYAYFFGMKTHFQCL